MGPEERLAQLVAEATTLRAKANTADFNEADAARASAIAKEHKDLNEIIARKSAVNKSFAGLDGGTTQDNSDDAPGEGGRGRGRRKSKDLQLSAGVGAPEFVDSITRAFKAASGTIGGPAVQKALVPSGAVIAEFSGVIVNDPKHAYSLYELVTTDGVINGNAGSFLRQTSRDNQAAGVKNGDLKPFSNYGLEEHTYRLATVAHMAGPYQRQWFSDYGNLHIFLHGELAHGLAAAVDRMILHGGIDEEGAEFSGILNTTGIGQTAFTGSAAASIRQAITDLQVTGAIPKNIVLHPNTWAAIEQTQTTTQDYVIEGALTEQVTPRLFGLPVVLSPDMTEDEAVVGDLSTVNVLDGGSVEIVWHEGGQINVGTAEAPDVQELFRANKMITRAELRMALVITSTKTIRVASLVSGV